MTWKKSALVNSAHSWLPIQGESARTIPLASLLHVDSRISATKLFNPEESSFSTSNIAFAPLSGTAAGAAPLPQRISCL